MDALHFLFWFLGSMYVIYLLGGAVDAWSRPSMKLKTVELELKLQKKARAEMGERFLKKCREVEVLNYEVQRLDLQIKAERSERRQGDGARISQLIAEIEGLKLELNSARTLLDSYRRDTTAIPATQLKRLIMLCHPDKHKNSEAATEATQWLLKQR